MINDFIINADVNIGQINSMLGVDYEITLSVSDTSPNIDKLLDLINRNVDLITDKKFTLLLNHTKFLNCLPKTILFEESGGIEFDIIYDYYEHDRKAERRDMIIDQILNK